MSNSEQREILPTNLTPLHYDVELEPNFDSFKYNGKTSIDLKVNSADNIIKLNVYEINVSKISLQLNDSTLIDVETFDNDNEAQILTINLANESVLKDFIGKTIRLNIEFVGELNENMAGFYRAKYEDKITGETKYMATTQMEPTDARRAFPCFDEPNLKSTFSITLISSPNYTHLSNMDVKSEVIDKETGKKITLFNVTPKMSTYLVAFIVAELKYVENRDFRIPVRVYATPGNEKDGQYAADLTAKTLSFFEKTFNIQYPLPKIDNVAVHEFSAGAMENWGLVTYRVVDVLIDEKNATLDRVQRVAEVVQHELAHQWFGNLVTMDWWEGLWLNEGFATWMSWYSCNEFQPSWNVWEQYVTDTLQHALSLDSLRSSHPIEVPVKRADEINQIFDAISYSKGASLLRMISKWLGEDVFIKGVSNYLNEFKYSNAKTEDLWKALSAASGKDVSKVMNIWTKKVGFPIIIVEEDPADPRKITLTQNRYLSTGDVKPEEDETLYPVFLALRTKEGVDHSVVFNEKTTTINLKDDSDFFKINGGQAGIYITKYSDERYAKLSKQRDLLSVEDRTGLVADVKGLASSGYTSTTNFLKLVSDWKNEESFVVWEQIINSLSGLKSTWIFESEDVKEALDEFTRQLISEKIHKLGWTFTENKGETSSFAEQRLKVTLFSSAAAARDPVVERAAMEMFEKYTSGDKNAIHPLIKPVVFATAGRIGGIENYEKIFNIYKNPETSDEKLAALRTLGRFNDPQLIQRTLGYLLDGTVLNQDIYIPMGGLRGHKEGIIALWKWMQENWDELVKRLPPGLSMLGSVLVVGTSGFTSLESVKDIETFFKGKSTKGFDQNLAQSLDTITSKAQWITRDADLVKSYLKDNGFYK
ncbi:hypothetical protein TPHA_0D01680 [Tetrapisispora phaffii CBS 4417]|uniref:Aminopeptidase n=1 Tax=Tetrapisispora phaffii (strain ATCC 24235 / CBS 4417 / NBRC 1672 / NRRL Y-8282 / UCD 70-5) TaxID=1071381 RepID=G8BSI7_TETPH|nr:hypothetical protein TPHA_0D01680 [Tetrapisispora phaffii CBS 4417]CCE62808.1 hypothetical protein TPHA_0D01680 [Tetrapisispora phaffii CBS 4417]